MAVSVSHSSELRCVDNQFFKSCHRLRHSSRSTYNRRISVSTQIVEAVGDDAIGSSLSSNIRHYSIISGDREQPKYLHGTIRPTGRDSPYICHKHGKHRTSGCRGYRAFLIGIGGGERAVANYESKQRYWGIDVCPEDNLAGGVFAALTLDKLLFF